MGEAKRRKTVDPSYGKPKRGLVVSSPIEVNGSMLTCKSSNLDPQQLRAWLLFFDRLVWPSSRAIHFGSEPDELFLERCNVLSRPDYTFNGDLVKGYLAGQISAFRDLNEKEPGLWALAQGETSLLVHTDTLVPDHGAMLEIYNAIPVPNRDVPLNDILEFRHKRYDELGLLRTELDSIVSLVSASNDGVSELERQRILIDKACADVIKVSHEWQFPVVMTNLKASFDMAPFAIISGALATYSAAGHFGLSETTTLAASLGVAAASSFKISGGFGFRGLKKQMGAYRYVYQFHKELF